MLKKVIAYTDFDGNQRTDTCYFNLTKAEVLEMNLSKTGGLEGLVKNIINEQDMARLYGLFKEIVLSSYGKKSVDGKRFIKKENGVRLADEFEETEAFSELMTEILTSADAAAAFVNGVTPGEIQEKMNDPQVMAAIEEAKKSLE